jgi:hypothetical protein
MTDLSRPVLGCLRLPVWRVRTYAEISAAVVDDSAAVAASSIMFGPSVAQDRFCGQPARSGCHEPLIPSVQEAPYLRAAVIVSK